MVTAVLIPIICIYFYFLTKKEMKEHESKWLAIGDVQEEAVISGKITTITVEKQRFYNHRYIIVQELQVQTDLKTVRVKKMLPYTKNASVNTFHSGEYFRFYGNWKGECFVCNRMKVIDELTGL